MRKTLVKVQSLVAFRSGPLPQAPLPVPVLLGSLVVITFKIYN